MGYTVGNLVLRRRVSRALNLISKRISDDIPPQMKVLNMIISILMQYYYFSFKKTVKMYDNVPMSSGCKLHKTVLL